VRDGHGGEDFIIGNRKMKSRFQKIHKREGKTAMIGCGLNEIE
jgi:hypothetical protein